MKRKITIRAGILIALVSTLILTANAFAETKSKIASKNKDIVGIWQGQVRGEIGYRQFNEDGTMGTSETVDGLSEATPEKFWFENNIFHVQKTDTSEIGTYNVTLVKEKGQGKKLNFSIVEEPKEKRGEDISAPMTEVKP